MKKNIIFVIVVIVVGVAAFYGGLKYGSASPRFVGEAGQAPAGAGGQFGNFAGRNGGTFATRNGGTNGGFVSGQVVSLSNQSLTLSLRDGSSRVILFGSSTAVLKSTSGTLNDVSQGSDLTVIGTANSDGSLTAQTIQIRPSMQRSQAQ